jgi:hypothetical protein
MRGLPVAGFTTRVRVRISLEECAVIGFSFEGLLVKKLLFQYIVCFFQLSVEKKWQLSVDLKVFFSE